ncbi:MAG: hypothetical protein AAGA21_19445 [Pseudomonadota bacterium]
MPTERLARLIFRKWIAENCQVKNVSIRKIVKKSKKFLDSDFGESLCQKNKKVENLKKTLDRNFGDLWFLKIKKVENHKRNSDKNKKIVMRQMCVLCPDHQREICSMLACWSSRPPAFENKLH